MPAELSIPGLPLQSARAARVRAPALYSTPTSAALAAVNRLLDELGGQATLEAAAPRAYRDASPEGLAAQLQSCGRPARVVRVEANELEQLTLPTLIMLHSGAAVVLAELSRRSATLSLQSGERLRLERRALAARFTGEALDLSPTLEQRGTFLPRLWRLLDREKHRFVAPLLATGVVVGLGLLGPLLTRSLMDGALPNADRSLLHTLVLATLLIAAHAAWLSWLRERALLAVSGALEAAILRGLYAQFVRIPFLAAQARSVGTFCEAMGSAVSVSRTATSALLAPLFDGATALAYLVLLFGALPLVAALSLLCGAFMLGLTLLFAPRLSRLQEQLIDASAQQLSGLHEMLSGASTLKTCGAERAAMARWLPRLIAARALAIRSSRIQQWLELGSSTPRQIVSVLMFAWGAQAVLARELSVGGFVASVMFADGYLSAMSRIASVIVPLFNTRGRLRPLDALLQVEPASDERPAQVLERGSADAIVLDDVWFRYTPDGPWILEGYQLRVAQGSQFVLRGPSGMGKTTILRLIAGLVQPEKGRVLVFGQNASASSGAVAYLPQDAVLFAGSLLSNLRILSGASHERILAAAQITGLSELAAELPMGLETLLPPGGTNLSGGQRQLVLMTAAVASERALLLLDESLANLDRLTQQHLRNNQLFTGKTVLSVAHD